MHEITAFGTIVLIVGSCVTLGRLLGAAAPVLLLELGLLAMATVDAILVFGNQLQAPNAVLVAAALIVTVGLGLAGTLLALNQKPATVLRNL